MKCVFLFYLQRLPIFAFLYLFFLIMLPEMYLGSHILFTDHNYNWNISTNLENLQNIIIYTSLFGGF
jgi:hypothetical protein